MFAFFDRVTGMMNISVNNEILHGTTFVHEQVIYIGLHIHPHDASLMPMFGANILLLRDGSGQS
jgi:hypothetical protein